MGLPDFPHHQGELETVLRQERLLQSGHIRVASEIPNPEAIPVDELMNLWLLVESYMAAHRRFVMIAFTQFSEQTMQITGADPALSRIIYAPKWAGEDGLYPKDLCGRLIINPRMQIPRFSTPCIAVEGCGSIARRRGKQLRYLMSRPSDMDLTAHIWQPGLARPLPTGVKQIRFTVATGNTEHEIHHLDGLDATHFPDRLIDMANPVDASWIDIREFWQPHESPKALARRQHDIDGSEWIVYRDNALTITDYLGNYLQPFDREELT